MCPASPVDGPPRLFDRDLLRRRRDRAAGGDASHNFLFRAVAERLVDRLDDVRRHFPLALDLGCRTGIVAAALGARGGIETLIQSDLSPAMARRARAPGRPALAGDEECLPFAAGVFDLVLSNFALHWVNDLPGVLAQIRRVLRPDGLFLAALPGGETLWELRQVLVEAEVAARGGASPRVAPFADLRDVGGLLQRAGFALPVADRDRITIRYPDALTLMRDLRGMGEASTLHERPRGFTRRETLFGAASRYEARFAEPDGRVPATVDVLFLTAWAPDPSQAKPLRPGSAEFRLADALESDRAPKKRE